MNDPGSALMGQAWSQRKARILRDAAEIFRTGAADTRDPDLHLSTAFQLEQRAVRILAGEPDPPPGPGNFNAPDARPQR